MNLRMVLLNWDNKEDMVDRGTVGGWPGGLWPDQATTRM